MHYNNMFSYTRLEIDQLSFRKKQVKLKQHYIE
jgi:hypothetical protein